VILGGRFYKTPHGFQHRSLGNLMLPVLTIFVGFFSIFGLFDTPPPLEAEHCKYIMLRFQAKRRIMYLQCSALTKMGGGGVPPPH